jgi:hypothetical protein
LKRSKRSLFILQIQKIEAERTPLIPEIGKIEVKKELDLRGGIFKTFMELRNQFQGIDSASLCPGEPVQQPYSSSFPSPLRLFLESIPQLHNMFSSVSVSVSVQTP